MLEGTESMQGEVETHLVGLVRNPYDVIYSAWTRWGYDPETYEREWAKSNDNLLRLKSLHPERITLFRYEDLGQDNEYIDRYVRAICPGRTSLDKFKIHQKSIFKWEEDRYFGHQLANTTRELALQLGYPAGELNNKPFWGWTVLRDVQRTKSKLRKLIKR